MPAALLTYINTQFKLANLGVVPEFTLIIMTCNYYKSAYLIHAIDPGAYVMDPSKTIINSAGTNIFILEQVSPHRPFVALAVSSSMVTLS